MNTASDITNLVEDLAAHWTEPALEMLRGAGIRAVSVEMELETWQTLKKVLQSELRWQRAFRFSTLVSLGTLMEQVFRQATLSVAQRFEPQSVSSEFENRIRRLAGDRRSTAAERDLFARMVRLPAMRAAFKPPSRTDYFPHLKVSALGG
jgi:hypothetical protein